ncbi:MAG: glycosyltransferase family 39 protein, partial [Chloroflexi bacterium]|nr:glycosyltransferase family 39 protein [Chloroflexota bacterium]
MNRKRRPSTSAAAGPMRTLPRSLLLLLGLLMAVTATLGGKYIEATPAWQAPDEPAHFNYALHIASGGGLPVLVQGDWDQGLLDSLKSLRFPPNRSVEAIRYESHQPPLYYVLGAPALALTAGRPAAEQVQALRWMSLLWAVLLLPVGYAIVRRVVPESPGLALAVPAAATLIPQFLSISASANNDSLAVLLFSLILLALVHRITGPSGKGLLDRLASPVGLGLLLGLALLTKTTIYAAALLIPAGLVAEWIAGGRRAPLRLLIRDCAVVIGVALLVSGWWFIRNAIVYGGVDITGLGRHDQIVVGQPRTGPLTFVTLWTLIQTAFRSFWMQMGWMAAPAEDWVYALLAMLAGASCVGLALWLWRGFREAGLLRNAQGWAMALCAAAAALIAGELAGYNLTFVQPQGRYLFYAIVPIALGLLLGLR